MEGVPAVMRGLSTLVLPTGLRCPGLLTVSTSPWGLGATCALRTGPPSAAFPFASASALASAFAWVVSGPEGDAPLTAGVLGVDAESSTGAGRPTDCASFTTSWATCSAITVSGAVVAQDAMSDLGSESRGARQASSNAGVSGDDCDESSALRWPGSSMSNTGARKMEGIHLRSDAISRHEGPGGRFRSVERRASQCAVAARAAAGAEVSASRCGRRGQRQARPGVLSRGGGRTACSCVRAGECGKEEPVGRGGGRAGDGG